MRQLEHRIADLEASRARALVRRQEAAQEIARAREGLERPFKYDEQLPAARAELAAITEQMRAAVQAAPARDDASPPLGRGRSKEPHSPRRAPSRYPARPRPPAPAPPDVHGYAPPGGVEL